MLCSLAQLSSMGTEEVPLPSLLRSRHSAERRGATTKQEKKKTRSWPDIGVLEWATVKQASVNMLCVWKVCRHDCKLVFV